MSGSRRNGKRLNRDHARYLQGNLALRDVHPPDPVDHRVKNDDVGTRASNAGRWPILHSFGLIATMADAASSILALVHDSVVQCYGR